MVVCLFYIVSNHIFKRQHAIYVQISGPGHEIPFVRIFGGELITDQMTAVVEVFAVYVVVLHGVPAGRFDHTDPSALFRWHGCFADIGISSAAAAERI